LLYGLEVLVLWIWSIIALEGFRALMARRSLRESLIIKILFENIDFLSIKAFLIAWVSTVKMLASGWSLNSFEVWLVE